MEKLSVFITSFNSEPTLAACLESVKWADEIVLVDSLSQDDTLNIARRYGCRIYQQEFLGYSKQKQWALDQTTHRWVLLLDSDEALSAELQGEIQRLLEQGLDADGYQVARQEQIFWRMADPRARMNHFLRLFDKTKGKISEAPVHESPVVSGTVKRLSAVLYHYGERDIFTKVSKANTYSSASVTGKVSAGRRARPWMMIFYPPLYFLRIYVLKRNFLNGWAGFIASVISAYYVFLKYAKLYEHYQVEKHQEKDAVNPDPMAIVKQVPRRQAD